MDFYLKKNLGLRMNIAQAMKMAAQQAELGLEQTSPNPCVGAVILDSKEDLIGIGYHKKYGGPHAEVEAFQSVYNQGLVDSNADLFKVGPFSVFVTLEPCAHEGKTPSCAKMLAAHPLSKVIYLLKDPNALVSGQGHKILEDVGIKTYCVEDILASKRGSLNLQDENIKLILKYKKEFKKIIKQQRHLNRHFLHAMTSERPYVTLKWAQTLDCCLGNKYTFTEGSNDTQRLLITNSEVQKEVHHLRACHDIVMVGHNTILNDNPQLTNRIGSSRLKENKIAILDIHLDVLQKKEDLNIFKYHSKENLIFITLNKTDTSLYEKEGYQFIKVSPILDKSEQDMDLRLVLETLKKQQKINSVFVEGGAMTLTEFIKQGLFNEIYLYIAPKIIFKKVAVRLNPLLWFKFLIKNVFTLKVKILDDNLLIHFKK